MREKSATALFRLFLIERATALEKTMLYEHESPEATNQASQRAFAVSLVESVGHYAARQICRDNAWDGIFDILLDEPVSRWS